MPARRAGSVELLAHLILRDDGIHLYGFATEAERELFLRLISVSGIGPKMALAALSGSSTAEMRAAIASGDAKRFQVVPGIGKKTAERVIVELREVFAGELGAGARGQRRPADAPDARARGPRQPRLRRRPRPRRCSTRWREQPTASAPEDLIAAALRTAAQAA